jgi:hypothetical protein
MSQFLFLWDCLLGLEREIKLHALSVGHPLGPLYLVPLQKWTPQELVVKMCTLVIHECEYFMKKILSHYLHCILMQ